MQLDPGSSTREIGHLLLVRVGAPPNMILLVVASLLIPVFRS